MGLKLIQEIPSPETIFDELPMPEHLKKLKSQRDKKIKDIFTGENDQFLLIIGPCSADNEDAVCDYISRLGRLQEKVEDKVLIVPRIYTNKPRTTGEGYKGMVHQPSPTKKSNMFKGIMAMRKMHIRAINESGLTCADEMLYPENYAYLEDILSYVAIGARSVENQQHRLTVSGLDVPVGMKNATSGDISVMLNAIRAAQVKHNFIFRGWEVGTSGNPLAHAILRGAVNRYGRNIPNYHYEDIIDLLSEYERMNLQNPAIIIDTNHANSNKQYQRQTKIALETIYNMMYDDHVRKHVKGLMIESYIEGGRQDIGEGIYGKSITDPCIGWDETEKLIYKIADKL